MLMNIFNYFKDLVQDPKPKLPEEFPIIPEPTRPPEEIQLPPMPEENIPRSQSYCKDMQSSLG